MTKIVEMLPYDYYKNVRTSLIDTSIEMIIEDGFRCPKCKKVHKEIEYGMEIVCSNCGLHIEYLGGWLRCTMEVDDD